VDLAIKAAIALMSFRWPKLKETQTELGLGLSGSLAERLESAQARLQITVTTGITRPPDDPGVIDAAPVASAQREPVNPPQPPTPSSPSLATSPPKLRPVAAPELPPAPAVPGKPIPAHLYWAKMAKPER
jgi:hypothetical protein